MREALAQVAAAGFDLAHEFDTRETQALHALPAGRGILIGNTRALWPKFEAARRAEADPLDRYTERTLEAAFAGRPVFYAHRKYGGAFIPFQHLAVATGFGALAPSRLVVHPTRGPWFALRAVVVVEGERGPARAAIPQPCTCDARCGEALDAALADPFDWRAWLGVRDACAIRAQRYSDAQVEFHYTHAFPGRSPHDGE